MCVCAGERSFFPSQIKKAKVNEGPVSYLRNAEEGVGRWGGGDEWVPEASTCLGDEGDGLIAWSDSLPPGT